ncbi:hypothetical protein IFM89_012439 [Coptis chinensis]|uniref:Uncharacterized protein n=1 Tax=Coptis chinensis TaxID=261450 RepID=A0A835I9U2_9MAGN|nr:hypothetical protein IFM89_012439 [Coptis chinensis]
MIVQPGLVVDFLIANQNVRDPYQIDWAKAKRTLKNLRIKASPSNMENKIAGLSKLPCNQQTQALNELYFMNFLIKQCENCTDRLILLCT